MDSSTQSEKATPASSSWTSARLREKADEILAPSLKEKYQVGLAVGMIHGEQALTLGYGRVSLNSDRAPDEDTLFEIGSITKLFTALLLADMSLRGEVGLDDPVNRYLPPTAQLASRGGIAVTLRHLATHTSGLPRLPDNLDGKDLVSADPYAHYTVEDMYACLSHCRLCSRPGTRSLYSNFGAGLLGHVLGLAAGKSYEELVKEHICQPLGLQDTTITLSEEQTQRLAPGHAQGKPTSNWHTPALPGAGALFSTVRDMLRFLQANLHPADNPLQGALELAQTIQTQDKRPFYRKPSWMAVLLFLGLRWLFAWRTFGLATWSRVLLALLVPALVAWKLSGGLRTMGLGWHVDGLPASGRRAWWHNGGTGGYASYLGMVRETGTAVVLLANADQSPDPVGIRLLDASD